MARDQVSKRVKIITAAAFLASCCLLYLCSQLIFKTPPAYAQDAGEKELTIRNMPGCKLTRKGSNSVLWVLEDPYAEIKQVTDDTGQTIRKVTVKIPYFCAQGDPTREVYEVRCGKESPIGRELFLYEFNINDLGCMPKCGDGKLDPDEKCEPASLKNLIGKTHTKLLRRLGEEDVEPPTMIETKCPEGEVCGRDCGCRKDSSRVRCAQGKANCTTYVVTKGGGLGTVIKDEPLDEGEFFDLNAEYVQKALSEVDLPAGECVTGVKTVCTTEDGIVCESAEVHVDVPCCGDGELDAGEECDEGAGNGEPGVKCSKDCKLPCEEKGAGYTSTCGGDTPCCEEVEAGCCKCVAPKISCCGEEGKDCAEINTNAGSDVCYESEGEGKTCPGKCYWHEKSKPVCPDGTSPAEGAALAEKDCYCCACQNEPTSDCQRSCDEQGEGMSFCCLAGEATCPDILLQSPLQSGAELGDIVISPGGYCTVKCYQGVCPHVPAGSGLPSCNDPAAVQAAKKLCS